MNHLAKVAGGAAWMLLFKVAERAMSVIGIVILARLLLPEDFGLVAMATSVIALLEVLGTFSFDLAIIQRKEPTREHYDTAWTMNVLAATGGAVATALVAWPAAQFYSEPRLVGVMHVLALCWALQGLENIGTVNFRREMNFSREFHFLFAKKLWSFVVTVVLAWAFRNYWALLIGTLSSRVFGVALSYFMHPYRPRPSLARRRELMSFSGWVMANGVLYFLTTRLSHLMIGRLHGASALGVFTVGADLASLPSTELIAPIHRAAYPAFSRMAETPGGLRDGLGQVMAVLVLIGMPACVGLAAVAEPLVLAMLGERWQEAAIVVAYLAFAGVVGVVTSSNYIAYLAVGKTYVPPMIGVVHVGALGLLLWTFAGNGVLGAAQAHLGASIVVLLPSLYFMYTLLEFRGVDLWRALWRPTAASGVMWLVVTGSAPHIAVAVGNDAYVVQLASLVPLGIVTYVSVVLLGWVVSGRPPGAEQLVIEYVRQKMTRVNAPLLDRIS